MTDERYMKLLSDIGKYGLDKGCAVEVMAWHNQTGQTVKQLCGLSEKEVLRHLIEGYLHLKEQRSKLEAENASLRERIDKAVSLPCKVGDTLYCTADCIDGVTYEAIEQFIRKIEVTEKNLYKMCNEILQGRAFFTHNAVVSRLAEYAEFVGEK